MNERGNQYALAALRERRAEVSGEIVDLERRLRHLRDTLVHLDATLRFLDPEANPTKIANKRPYKRVKLFGAGKLNWLILDAMRKGDRPMTTAEVIAAIVADLGYGEDAARGMRGRVRANLFYLSAVKRIVKEGERATAKWSLTKDGIGVEDDAAQAYDLVGQPTRAVSR